MIPSIPQILDWRKTYFASAHTVPFGLSDVDFVIALFFSRVLEVKHIYIDDSAAHPLFASTLASDSSAVSVHATGEPITPSPPDGLHSLFILSATRPLQPSLLQRATNPGSLIMLYGFSEAAGIEIVPRLADLLKPDAREMVFLPLWGLAPSLWHACSGLVVSRDFRPAAIDAIRDVTAAFSAPDLDALPLLEENLRLRSQVNILRATQPNNAEIESMRSTIAQLQTELAALRRLTLAQEQTIATQSRLEE